MQAVGNFLGSCRWKEHNEKRTDEEKAERILGSFLFQQFLPPFFMSMLNTIDAKAYVRSGEPTIFQLLLRFKRRAPFSTFRIRY